MEISWASGTLLGFPDPVLESWTPSCIPFGNRAGPWCPPTNRRLLKVDRRPAFWNHPVGYFQEAERLWRSFPGHLVSLDGMIKAGWSKRRTVRACLDVLQSCVRGLSRCSWRSGCFVEYLRARGRVSMVRTGTRSPHTSLFCGRGARGFADASSADGSNPENAAMAVFGSRCRSQMRACALCWALGAGALSGSTVYYTVCMYQYNSILFSILRRGKSHITWDAMANLGSGLF